MKSSIEINGLTTDQKLRTAKSLRTLYFTRAAFSITWVIIVLLLPKSLTTIAAALLILYPAWDVVGTFLDIRANRNNTSRLPQYTNIAISTITTIAVALSVNKSIGQTLVVFGAWAILTGIIQLILGLKRRKLFGGQWPMIISGGQSILGGVSFIMLANAPDAGIKSLAGYVAFGAFYYILAAYRLNKKVV